ncbi:MAG: hypothetical protein U9Q90_01030 [Campylobacterota bacterium]|nr:hypothetical protein [Campylobacterota bacterium]
MEIEILKSFFMWCTILNGSIYLLWVLFFFIAPDFIYRQQCRWFPIPRESYNVIIYSALGFFKIVFIVFNIVPYVALLIIG